MRTVHQGIACIYLGYYGSQMSAIWNKIDNNLLFVAFVAFDEDHRLLLFNHRQLISWEERKTLSDMLDKAVASMSR